MRYTHTHTHTPNAQTIYIRTHAVATWMKGDREVNNKQHHSSSSGRLIYKLHSGGVARCLCVVPFSVFCSFLVAHWVREHRRSSLLAYSFGFHIDRTHSSTSRFSRCVVYTFNSTVLPVRWWSLRCPRIVVFFLLLDRSCPALLPREHFLCGNLIQFYTIMKYW